MSLLDTVPFWGYRYVIGICAGLAAFSASFYISFSHFANAASLRLGNCSQLRKTGNTLFFLIGLNEPRVLRKPGAFDPTVHLKWHDERQWHVRRPHRSALPLVFVHDGALGAPGDDRRHHPGLPRHVPPAQEQDEEAQDTESARGVRTRQRPPQSRARQTGDQALRNGETHGGAEKRCERETIGSRSRRGRRHSGDKVRGHYETYESDARRSPVGIRRGVLIDRVAIPII
ncbi:hypothetical protein C0J50_14845 [Silurus asotus]|uniref:Uncharacterized protein n=1 Tax=Silurus asotus TaxID=30991 RepID=A0AAD5FR79_SILAS|nr:hypothetical protein C0J50_14845 [Silurus asotus]